MSATSLATLRTRVRQLGNYENSTRFTDAFLNDQINAALAELYELVADVNEGYFDVVGSLTTTSGVDTVALPADFWRCRGIDIQDAAAALWVELRQVGLQERNRYQLSNGVPVAFRIAAGGTRGQLVLYPTPGAAYPLRLLYEPTRAVLSADGDSVEDYNWWSDYIVTAALLRCDEREQRPLGDRAQKLDAVRKRIVSGASRRRESEPEYLIPRGRGLPDSWGFE